MMVMCNILFLGWKKETAFPELSLISTRARTMMCFAQVSASMWVVAETQLYRVWRIAWLRLSIRKAVLEFLWLTTDILWQHLTCNQVSKVDIFLNSSLSPYLNYHYYPKIYFANLGSFNSLIVKSRRMQNLISKTVWEWSFGSTGRPCTLLGILSPQSHLFQSSFHVPCLCRL